MPRGDGVILLHGLGRTSASMVPLAHALRRDGFDVLNLDHPTRQIGIAALADHVDAASARWRAGRTSTLHLVGHSLGGLVARAFVARHRPSRLGRVVLLGSPSGGSEMADLLVGFATYRRIFGPAGSELTTVHAARDALLGELDYPLGIIAGTRSLDPLGWALLPKPNDGKVTTARTKVAGATHLTLPVTHTLMMRAPSVIAATSRFLREGRFTPS